MKQFIRFIIALIFIVVFSESIGTSLIAADTIKNNSSAFDSAIGANAKKIDSSEKAKADTSVNTDSVVPTLTSHRMINILLGGLFFLVAFILGGILTYWFLKIKIIAILQIEKDDYLSKINNSNRFHPIALVALFEYLKIRKDIYKLEVDNLNNNFENESGELFKLTEEIREIKRKNQELERSISELDKLRTDAHVGRSLSDQESEKADFLSNDEKNISKKGLASIYFTIPETDGSFSVEKGENFSSNKKFYRIDYPENSDQGQLFFLPGDFDIKAINNIDYYLMPVCEVENLAITSTATRILQMKSGSVVKIADKWIIDKDKKVKIKLI